MATRNPVKNSPVEGGWYVEIPLFTRGFSTIPTGGFRFTPDFWSIKGAIQFGDTWIPRACSLGSPLVCYYCWWFRNPANQLRLVVYPIIYRVLYISGAAGFLKHQQYVIQIVNTHIFVGSTCCLNKRQVFHSQNKKQFYLTHCLSKLPFPWLISCCKKKTVQQHESIRAKGSKLLMLEINSSWR